MVQDPISAHWGHLPLLQHCRSMAGLQLPAALPCLAVDHTELGPPMSPHLSLASACLHA